MKNVILLRYGEIHLKGKNRGYFENALLQNINKTLKNIPCVISRIAGRYLVSNYSENVENEIIEKCKKVFGFVSLSPAIEIDTNQYFIEQTALNFFKNYVEKRNSLDFTFRVHTKRADKNFAIHSDEFSAKVGEIIINEYPSLKVNLKNADIILEIDIRENGKTYITLEKIHCAGGMPIGTAGTGLLMLSGGIDSPVAGYMMAKRGLKLNAIHFHSYPYTSLQARDKVLKLAKILTEYTGEIRVFLVPFTKIQEEIHKNCDSAYMINIMRRIMFRIAENICLDNHLQTIITGESLAQVASQTIESLTNTNSVMKTIPVMRPLIAYDKIDTIELSKKIGTFETSILPYEDCCTVFLPENPIIKPKIENSIKQEEFLKIDELIEEALNNLEIIKV